MLESVQGIKIESPLIKSRNKINAIERLFWIMQVDVAVDN